MFPLSDENPIIRPPVVTVTIITLNTLAWILVQGWGHEAFLIRSLCHYGLIPGALMGELAAVEPGDLSLRPAQPVDSEHRRGVGHR